MYRLGLVQLALVLVEQAQVVDRVYVDVCFGSSASSFRCRAGMYMFSA
jgi:hypothetical protein